MFFMCKFESQFEIEMITKSISKKTQLISLKKAE